MENTIRGSFSENQAAEIKLPATERLKFVKSLGAGKAARVELMKNEKGRVFAEKHFTNGSILTRWTYKLAFQAPLPYRTNINAVATAYYTRKVVRDLTVAWFGTPRVADALYIRWDNKHVGWVLGTEYIKGRGPDPVLRNSKYEISELMAFMDKLMDHLYEAGLYGPMWQADKGLSVPTSNFLLDENENWIWIDLESAVPGLRFFKPKPYLKDARQKGFIPLFADIDFEKLSNYLEKNQDLLLKYPLLQTTVKKLQAHMRAWKESEISIFRNRAQNKPRFFHEDKLKRNVTNQYLGAWKHEYEITRKVENRVRNSIWKLLSVLFFADLRYLVANENYRGRWIERKYFKMELKRRIPIGYRKKLLRNYIMSKFLFKELHLWL
ncbi:hypothetical protein KA005_00315, partial [bacterium]|nr:hypothetical protein [bacterium]